VTDQHVTCLNNSTFSGYQFISSKSSGLVYFDDEVNFENVQVLFQGNQLELPQNSTLVLHKGYLLDCNLHGNGSTSVVHGEGTYASEGHFLQTSSFENVRFTGEWAFSNNIELNGTILNDGILQNAYYSNSVEVFANFINNGTIRNYVGGITMKMYGDFTNNGIWKGHTIDLHGSGDQNIELADNMILEPTYFTSFKPSGQIISTNDLEFQNTLISMNNTPLILPEQGTLRISGQYMQHADIMAQSGRFNLVTSNYAFLHSCQFQDVSLYGDIYLQDNSFYGTTINYGTMQNNYYAFTANFYGDLVNYGTIQHYASAFVIYAHADIINNGNWNNIYTKMVGTTDQYIHLNNGHGINGEMYLLSDLTGSSYQWYFNTWAISTFFPDPDPFSGYTLMELKFNVPVAAPWAGEYKCWVDGNFSRKIIVDYTTTPQFDITAMLEGPFNGSQMNTDINSMIPLHQSLGIIGYDGPETVMSIPNNDIIDWIGLELRDAPDAASATEATTIAGGAYFLLKDGTVVGLDGSSLPTFDISVSNQLFVLLWHRNHLPVMSKYPLTESGGIYSYDFTTAAGQAYGDNQSDLGGGFFGMIGGNANGDGEINEFDRTEYWMQEVGHTGYLQSDVNMDTQVDNKDKNDIWIWKRGKSEILPQLGFNNCGDVLIDDRDGKAYNTVQIGDQCWMAENLKIGTMVPNTTTMTDNSSIEKYCYGNVETSCDEWGGLYQWQEAMSYATNEGAQGICPDGWHLPSDNEWCTLENYLDPTISCAQTGARGIDGGGKLKETGNSHWNDPNSGATNSSGFTAIPNGYKRNTSGNFNFEYQGDYGYWWSSTVRQSYPEAYLRHLYFDSPQVRRDYIGWGWGFSVRCVKNQ
jgi:uncharacterized protein (TIGR02145 family)